MGGWVWRTGLEIKVYKIFSVRSTGGVGHVDQKIHESQNEFARVVDLKIQDTAKIIGNNIDSQIKFAKENLSR